jgi:hypothetical protein
MIQSYRTFRRSFVLQSLAGLTVTLALAVPKIASAACTPTGLIEQKWAELEGDFGPCLDNPTSDKAGGTIEQFEFGFVDWIYPEPQAFGVWGLIASAWVTRYGGPGATGQPVTDEQPFGDGGAINTFVRTTNCGGSGEPVCGATTYLVWNPGGAQGPTSRCFSYADNVCQVYGLIGELWHEIGGGAGELPIDEASVTEGFLIQQDFGPPNGGFLIQYNQQTGCTWARDNNTGALLGAIGSCEGLH